MATGQEIRIGMCENYNLTTGLDKFWCWVIRYSILRRLKLNNAKSFYRWRRREYLD